MAKRMHSQFFRWHRRVVPLCLIVVLTLALLGCGLRETHKPEYYEVYELYGSPYERGYQHGFHFANKIRSLYTKLLTNAIFPYLNRDRPDVASVMLRYQDEEIYGDGKFSYQMMLESGYKLLDYIPDQYVEEMQGIADGSGVPFDQILVMNTFFDTLMGFRSITFYIKLAQGPWMTSTRIVSDKINNDGFDNDGDGEIDEYDEGIDDPYEPRPFATYVEVPTDASIRFTIDDDKEGADPDSIRIQMNDTIYTADQPCIQAEPYARDGKTIAVTFTPPDGFPPASEVSLIIQATDLCEFVRIAPHHPRSMRDERITITTVGYGKHNWEVPNRGEDDGRTQPPSLGFAAWESATTDGRMFLAHNFAMLDSDTAHKHATLMIHHTDEDDTFGVVGYPGLIWGFSGMNAEGLAYLFNSSDTLNTPFLDSFNQGLIFGYLEPAGVPVGIMGRHMLQNYDDVYDAADYIADTEVTFGWNFLLADAKRQAVALEVDADIEDRPGGGTFMYDSNPDDPENHDAWGQMLASVGPHDLRVASSYVKDLEEINYQVVNFKVKPQRYWSTFYWRSVRSFWNTERALEQNLGTIDLQGAIDILSRKELVDQRDSMNSVVYDPEHLMMYVAAGQVPTVGGKFKPFDLGNAAANPSPPPALLDDDKGGES